MTARSPESANIGLHGSNGNRYRTLDHRTSRQIPLPCSTKKAVFALPPRAKLLSENATFTSPAPGEWRNLRDLFISSFRANPNSTFGPD
jgi:hypothetical protein